MKNRAIKYTVALAFVGVVIILMISYAQHNLIVTYEHNLTYLKLGDRIKSRVTLGQLRFDEAMAGDTSVDFEKDVVGNFLWSRNIVQNTYDGKDSELGSSDKDVDEETRVILKEAIIAIDYLTEAAKDQWFVKQHDQADSDGNAGLGAISEVGDSVNSDKEFIAALTKIDHLGDHVSKILKSESNYSNTVSWVFVGVVTVAFILLCVLLYRVQRNNDEVSDKAQARLDEQADNADQLSNFIEAVSLGNFAVELAVTGDDGLTNKLITMRNKLKENAESERKQAWSTTGLAQVGEILRATTSKVSDLYDHIILFLVKYTKSNQGGLFIIDDEEEAQGNLELVASYAFERKKFLTKTIEPGVGLVGQCFLEGEQIYLEDVPEGYVSITSGLGESNPRAILLMPMKVNDRILGVIELATFTRYEDYEIELVGKLAESIASTISSVRINESTRMLLERTQQQSEEMKAQEEEIRQNMEELEATQEEMQRKQAVLEKELAQSQEQSIAWQVQEKKIIESHDILQAIVEHIPRAIFWKDKDLRFVGCNTIFAHVAGFSSHLDMLGKSDYDTAWSAQADIYRKDDFEVMDSRTAKLDIEEMSINSEGEKSWVLTSKVPIINARNEVIAILGMFEDITEKKKGEADIAEKLLERDQSLKEIQELKHLLEARG